MWGWCCWRPFRVARISGDAPPADLACRLRFWSLPTLGCNVTGRYILRQIDRWLYEPAKSRTRCQLTAGTSSIPLTKPYRCVSHGSQSDMHHERLPSCFTVTLSNKSCLARITPCAEFDRSELGPAPLENQRPVASLPQTVFVRSKREQRVCDTLCDVQFIATSVLDRESEFAPQGQGCSTPVWGAVARSRRVFRDVSRISASVALLSRSHVSGKAVLCTASRPEKPSS